MIRTSLLLLIAVTGFAAAAASSRERISINDNWRFAKGDPTSNTASLLYDVRPDVRDRRDDRAADTQPTEAEKIAATNRVVLKPWILPTGNPATLKLEPDRTKIHANGVDLAFVTVTVTDKSGLTVPRADHRLHFTVEGPGEIVATDNGDPTSFESFQAHNRKAFNGLCLAIIRGKPGQSGKIKLMATSDGLTAVSTIIAANSSPF